MFRLLVLSVQQFNYHKYSNYNHMKRERCRRYSHLRWLYKFMHLFCLRSYSLDDYQCLIFVFCWLTHLCCENGIITFDNSIQVNQTFSKNTNAAAEDPKNHVSCTECRLPAGFWPVSSSDSSTCMKTCSSRTWRSTHWVSASYFYSKSPVTWQAMSSETIGIYSNTDS